MAHHEIRFGVSGAFNGDPTQWAATARHAEEIGFDALHVADHLVARSLSPFSAAGVALGATERLRVGTLVLNNDFRHPVIVAREASTLGLLSDSRFELGLGAGHMKFEYDEAGIPFDPAGVRVERLAESAAIVRGLLAGEQVTFEGEHYQVHGHQLGAVPARAPLTIGGNGRRVLETAARLADIVGFTGFLPNQDGSDARLTHLSAAGIAERVLLVREAAGHRFDAVELQVLVQQVAVTDRRRAEAERVAGRWKIPLDVVLDTPFLLLGSAEHIAEQILGWRERLGLSYFVTFAARPESDQTIDTLAPVIALVRP
ncbi:MAG: TIGR03621 family F420-dependent LLM class oxidoreductase [Acidimicrobiia bacterium]